MTTIAEVREYSELLQALLSYVPDHVDVPPQMLRPVPIKVLGQTTLGAILGALGLKTEVHTDDEQLAKIRHRLPPRKNARALSQMPAPRYSYFRGDGAKARAMHRVWDGSLNAAATKRDRAACCTGKVGQAEP